MEKLDHGSNGDPTAFLKGLLQEYDPYEPYLRFRLMRAGRMLTRYPEIERSVAWAVAREIFDLLLDTRVSALRDQAVEILSALLDTDMKPSILTWIQRISGAYYTSSLGALVKHPDVRSIIVDWQKSRWLSGRKTDALEPVATQPEVRDTLLGLLTSPKEDVREVACKALGPVADDPAIRDKLISMLSDSGRFVPKYAARALGPHAGDPVIFAALKPLYEQKEWRRYGWLREVFSSVAYKPNVLGLLTEVFGDPESGIRRQVVETLRLTCHYPQVQAVLEEALRDPVPEIRKLAISSLEPALNSASVQQALVGVLSDVDPEVRGVAARALHFAPKLAVIREVLFSMLEKPHARGRAEVTWALGAHIEQEVVQARLIALLQDRDPHVQAASASALLILGERPRAAVAPAQHESRMILLRLLQSRKERVRGEAAYGLRPLADDAEVQTMLLPLLNDRSLRVRYNTMLSLYPRIDDARVQAAFATSIEYTSEIKAVEMLSKAPIPRESHLHRILARIVGRWSISPAAEAAYKTLAVWAEKEQVARAAETAGGNREAGSIEDIYEPYLHLKLLEAGRLLASDSREMSHERDESKGSAEEIARKLFDLMMETPVRPLISTVGEVLRGLLATKLRDTIAQWAVEAASGRRNIARLGELSSNEEIRQALMLRVTDPDWKARKAAAKAISPALPDVQVQGALLELLGDPRARVRKTAATLLRPVAGEPAVSEALLRTLSDSTVSVRGPASWALWEVGSRRGIGEVLVRLIEVGPEDVRPFAARTLAFAPPSEEIKDKLLALLTHADPQVRKWSVDALIPFARDEAVISAVLPLLGDDALVKFSAIDLLGYGADHRSVGVALFPLLSTREDAIRERVVKALARSASGPHVVEALLRVLETDVFWRARLWAVRALKPVAGQDIVREALIAALGHEEPLVIDEIVAALNSQLPNVVVKDEFVKGLAASDLRICVRLVGGLEPYVSDPEVRVALHELLTNYENMKQQRVLTGDEEAVRRAAARVLGKAGYDPLAWRVVQDDLDAGHGGLCAAGARSVGLMVREPAVRDSLRPLLTDYANPHWVRKDAAIALAPAVPDPWLVQPLGVIVDEPDVEAAEAAYKTLLIWATGVSERAALAHESA
jgi:HEAT repeat protein